MKSSRKSSARVTAKHIAEAAGVSQATVSMALRGSEEISPARIAQIRSLADSMSYHPRAAAQLLRSKRSGQIGVLTAASGGVHAFSRGFTGPLIGSVVDLCAKQGMRYIIEFCPDADSVGAPLPYQVTSGLVDGSIIIGDIGDALQEKLRQDFADYPWISVEEPSRYCVLADSRTGVHDLVTMLHGLGHRELAYACGPQKYHTHSEGFAGWSDAMTGLALGGQIDRHLIFGGSEASGIESVEALNWARRLLRQNNRPTAFVCHDMVVARAVIYAAVEMGLKVPQDLSVTSWGWHVPAQEQFPALSTMELNYRAMVERALELLKRLLDNEPVAESRLVMPLRYVEGATTAPPARGMKW